MPSYSRVKTTKRVIRTGSAAKMKRTCAASTTGKIDLVKSSRPKLQHEESDYVTENGAAHNRSRKDVPRAHRKFYPIVIPQNGKERWAEPNAHEGIRAALRTLIEKDVFALSVWAPRRRKTQRPILFL